MSNDPAYKRAWYLRNRARILQKLAARYRSDETYREATKSRVATWARSRRDYCNAQTAKRRVIHAEAIAAYSRRYRATNPKKVRAHAAVGHAIRDGLLKRAEACERCGSSRFVIGHHDDYSKPLEVRWVCRICHHRIHHQH